MGNNEEGSHKTPASGIEDPRQVPAGHGVVANGLIGWPLERTASTPLRVEVTARLNVEAKCLSDDRISRESR